MSLTDYTKLYPQDGESEVDYCRRLEMEGHEEMLMRKAMAHHFEMPIETMGEFFQKFETSRLRHLALLKKIHPKRTRYSFIKKVAKNLDVSDDEAERLVNRFTETGDLDYLP